MDFEKLIYNVFRQQDDCRLDFANSSTKIAALYLFYHYFNADVSRLDEVYDCLVNLSSNDSFVIKSILRSNNIDDAIDFNVSFNFGDFSSIDPSFLCDKIKRIAKDVGFIVYHDVQNAGYSELIKYDELQVKITDNTAFVIRLVCPCALPIETKISYQQAVSEIKVNNANVIFEIIFGDDLEEEVSDIENPKEYVSSGTVQLISDSVCFFGEEDSFVTLISAQSLKKLFLNFSTRGLFASNLRFYITSKKIDGKIVETIQNEPQNFCYFNNGIIVTCDDYFFTNNVLNLTNFSIVNGGQTTNLIGRTSFANDFGVICKVIKNKYSDKNERVQFLSKVAEASNMQKPINAKDLIANKPEQRLLKIQFSEAGMFLKIKRGEKIDKTLYPEPYMNASNDEVAQMLYSVVFQAPGAAKNSKSSIIGNDKTYNLLFKNTYNTEFLKSLQMIKVAYSDWQKKISKSESHSSVVYGLSRHANYYFVAVLGFLMKVITNSKIRSSILEIKLANINSKNLELKGYLKINDIGQIPLLHPDTYKYLSKTSLFSLIKFVFDNILIPSYSSFKRNFPNYAYAQFCKSDGYYYDFVLPFAKSLLCNKNKADELMLYLKEYFNYEGIADLLPSTEPEDNSSEGLEEELKQYRTKIASESGKSIKAFEVLKNMNIAYISRYFPTTYETLSKKCLMNDEQISLYGEDILRIVKKYIRTKDFE